MRVKKSEDGTGLVLAGIGKTELEMLRAVREAADPTACPDAERRLFPDPIEGVGEVVYQNIADWKEFVVPDLRSQFDEALDQLESDVAKAKKAKSRSKDRYSMEIQMGHVAHWFSALNQARLVLQEKYQFPEEAEASSLAAMFAKGQWRAYFQSRFYAELQCWLLELGDWH